MDREKEIIKTSIIGIVLNVILVGFKMVVGLLANSIAIILDAVNNLSDALSSVITIVGTKLAGKKPDKKHPYGYGRIEYVTSVIISVLVLFAGITSGKESILKILHPEKAEYTNVTLIIVGIAVFVKFFMGRYMKAVGNRIDSGALQASGADASMDAVMSLATLLTAIIAMRWHVSLEGYVGTAISVMIIKAGLEMLLESLNSIIGTRAEKELISALKEKVNGYTGVHGAYDVVLHNYGPEKMIGSLHIEVDDDMPAKEIHRLSRTIIEDIYESMGIIVTVGIYAANTTDPVSGSIQAKMREIIKQYPDILQLHGFYFDGKRVTFDLVIDFSPQLMEVKNKVVLEAKKLYPEYTFYVAVDTNYSE